MKQKGNKLLTDGLMRTCLSPAALLVAENAMVMCTKNNFEAGYVNGTLGRVIGFDNDTSFPKIITTDGRELVIKPATWSIVDHGKTIAEIEQIPLRLAWAITVHKSQGMSLDAVEVDLSRAFVYGQGYVALSRVRTLTGLKVIGMHPNALMVDPSVIRQDQVFRELAEVADSTFAAMSEEELTTMQKQFVSACGKQWPTGDISAYTAVGAAPPPKSTYQITAELLDIHQSLTALAKARALTTGTIVSHLEVLYDTEALSVDRIEDLLPTKPAWNKAKPELFSAMDNHATEKLKPIHDATNGEYDYIYLRLARLLYRAHTGG